MSDSLGALLRSRKFMVMMVDTAIAIALYFGSKYLGESAFADIKFLIAALQVPTAALINAIAKEDSAAWQSGARQATIGQPQEAQ